MAPRSTHSPRRLSNLLCLLVLLATSSIVLDQLHVQAVPIQLPGIEQVSDRDFSGDHKVVHSLARRRWGRIDGITHNSKDTIFDNRRSPSSARIASLLAHGLLLPRDDRGLVQRDRRWGPALLDERDFWGNLGGAAKSIGNAIGGVVHGRQAGVGDDGSVHLPSRPKFSSDDLFLTQPIVNARQTSDDLLPPQPISNVRGLAELDDRDVADISKLLRLPGIGNGLAEQMSRPGRQANLGGPNIYRPQQRQVFTARASDEKLQLLQLLGVPPGVAARKQQLAELLLPRRIWSLRLPGGGMYVHHEDGDEDKRRVQEQGIHPLSRRSLNDKRLKIFRPTSTDEAPEAPKNGADPEVPTPDVDATVVDDTKGSSGSSGQGSSSSSGGGSSSSVSSPLFLSSNLNADPLPTGGVVGVPTNTTNTTSSASPPPNDVLGSIGDALFESFKGVMKDMHIDLTAPPPPLPEQNVPSKPSTPGVPETPDATSKTSADVVDPTGGSVPATARAEMSFRRRRSEVEEARRVHNLLAAGKIPWILPRERP